MKTTTRKRQYIKSTLHWEWANRASSQKFPKWTKQNFHRCAHVLICFEWGEKVLCDRMKTSIDLEMSGVCIRPSNRFIWKWNDRKTLAIYLGFTNLPVIIWWRRRRSKKKCAQQNTPVDGKVLTVNEIDSFSKIEHTLQQHFRIIEQLTRTKNKRKRRKPTSVSNDDAQKFLNALCELNRMKWNENNCKEILLWT